MAGRRSEEASGRRVRRAQARGNVPGLADARLLSWALGVWVWAQFLALPLAGDLRGMLRASLTGIADDRGPYAALGHLAAHLPLAMGPSLLLLVACAAAPGLLRSTLAVGGRPRIRNPLAGLLDPSQGLAVLFGVARVLVLLLLCIQVVAAIAPGLRSLGLQPSATAAVDPLVASGQALAFRVLLAAALVAPIGLWLERILYRRSLRTTREERQREQLQDEVHPRVLQALRARSQASEDPAPAATHRVPVAGRELLVALDAEGRHPPRLVAAHELHGAGLPTQRDAILPTLALPPEVVRRLAQLSPGDSIPPACYPPMARAVARLAAPASEAP